MDLMAGEGAARVLHVVQGALDISAQREVVYTAVIGASVLVGLWDPVTHQGGMAHFQFPQGGRDPRFGDVAIPALVQRLRDAGAAQGGVAQGRLRAKLFGGARVHDGWQDIGKANVEFAQHSLVDLGIVLVSQDVGRDVVRRVRFRPCDGTSCVAAQNDGLPFGGRDGFDGLA
jgi:chemotaxis protein CheD